MNGLRLKPDRYQIEGALYSFKHHYSINGDDMGLGKSFQALMVANALNTLKNNTLIVCPASLKLNWFAEIKKCLKVTGPIRMFKKSKDITAPLNQGGFCIIGYTDLANAECLFEWASNGLVVYDEIHYLKEMSSARSLLSHQYLYEYAPPRFIGLSGTPIKNNPAEWFSPLTLVSYNMRKTSGIDIQKVYQTHEQFAKSICFYRHTGYQYEYGKLAKPKLLASLLKDKYIRREKSEVTRKYNISEKTVVMSIKEDPELLREYEAHVKAFKQSAKPEAKRKSALMKVKFTLQYCEDLIAAGEGPLVVFTDHPEVAELLAEGLKGRHIHGGVSLAVRNAIVNDFQEGHLDAVVLTIGAGSEGITLTRANNLIMNDINWVGSSNSQAKDRIDRKTQTRDVTTHIIIGSPQDLKIHQRVNMKNANVKEAL